MGKWDKLKGKYPRFKVQGDANFVEKVAALKAEYTTLNLKDLLAAFEDVKRQKDELEDQVKALNPELEVLSQLLVDELERQELHAVVTDSGRTVYLRPEPYCSVADREALEAYVDADPALAYLYGINWQQLNVLIKELLETGRDAEVPPGVKVFLKTSVGIRKA